MGKSECAGSWKDSSKGGEKSQHTQGHSPWCPKRTGLSPTSSLASPLSAAQPARIQASRSNIDLARRDALREDKQEVPEVLAGRSVSARRKLPKSRENLHNRDCHCLRDKEGLKVLQYLESAGLVGNQVYYQYSH